MLTLETPVASTPEAFGPCTSTLLEAVLPVGPVASPAAYFSQYCTRLAAT